MEQKMNLRALAKSLNLSISTVSKALNNSHEISAATKKRVKEAAKLHNYVPNFMGQNLKARKTKTIGVVIPDVLPHFFAKALHSIETTASQLGYKIIFCLSNESTEKEAESIRTLINGSVDGIIMSLAKETQANDDCDHLLKLKDYQIPLVLFDRVTHAIKCDKIRINDAEIAEEATHYLSTSGRRNILYLSSLSKTSVDKRRHEGYLRAVRSRKLENHTLHVTRKQEFEPKILRAFKENSIDAILAADELTAIIAMKIAITHGYSVPEDISVIGFTNGLMGENFVPSLSTVEQYAEDQGKLAVETMIARIEERLPEDFVSKVLQTSIIHRGSTIPAPIFSSLQV
ncbi:MAG: LacI family DNA-binding transcriptional regulator [Salegentibacter sp.]